MNENEFEYNGVIYSAAPACKNEFGALCEGCAFDDHFKKAPCADIDCEAYERADNRNVIFVEKQS